MKIPVLAACAVAILTLSSGAPVAAQAPAVTPPTIAELLQEGRIHAVSVSPGGQRLALVRHDGDRDFIQIIDLAARAQSTLNVLSEFERLQIGGLSWKSDDRLVFGFVGLDYARPERAKKKGVWPTRVLRGTMLIDRTGANPIGLAGLSLVSVAPEDPDHIIVQGLDDTTAGHWQKAMRVEIRTGKRETVDAGTAQTYAWYTDRAGRPVLRYEMIGQAAGTRVLGRAPEGDGEWKELFRLRPKDARAMPDMEIYSMARDSGQLYVGVKADPDGDGDTRELRLYDIPTRTMGPRLMSVDKYDFDDVRFDRAGAIKALCYWADVYRCDYQDPTDRREYDALADFFGPDRSVRMGSISDSGDVRVLHVSGPDEPGSYYLYDRKTKKTQLLGAQVPALHPDRLGPVRKFGWKARDGFDLSGYVTTPIGAPASRRPLILMPHGGPEARDQLEFDKWAQAFAARGYVVFQPNFRGSGGFGAKFGALGYRQWGKRMQEDVMDGVQALIDSGEVDPDRICVVGASYGGYASLYAGASAPERFKCVISVAGVSDLVTMLKWERDRGGPDSPAYQYWVKAIGDPDKDRAELETVSPVTYAADYRPPVLLIHGLRDTIVPVEQSRIMEKALRKAGRDVRLIEVENAGHGGWDAEAEEDFLTEMVAFVDKAIGGQPR